MTIRPPRARRRCRHISHRLDLRCRRRRLYNPWLRRYFPYCSKHERQCFVRCPTEGKYDHIGPTPMPPRKKASP
jgi:hypothetical protein